MQSCRQTRWWVDDCRLVQNWIHFLVIRPCARWLRLGSHTNYMIFQMNNHLKAMRPWWLIPHWINPSYICWTPFQHKLNFHEPVRYRINKAASVASCCITQSETARATVALGSLAPSIGTTSRFPGTSVDHDNDNLMNARMISCQARTNAVNTATLLFLVLLQSKGTSRYKCLDAQFSLLFGLNH